MGKNICYLLLISFISAAAQPSPPPFDPVDHITLGCGSETDSAGRDGRIWISDSSSKFPLLDQTKSSIASSPLQLPEKIIDGTPYKTARLSRSQFNYTFPVTSGPKLIRLYFYPTSYAAGGFNRSDAFFSVVSGGFTLVSNFSAALHADALGREAFYKEFSLMIQDDQRLNLTFTPSPDVNDSYAFINAIEIISTPPYLYYTNESEPGIVILGIDGNRQRIDSNTGLEMVYRLNVGGKSLSPAEDTGMFRSWDNDEDYLTVDVSSTQPVNSGINLNVSRIENYTAPKTVYQTARSMGMNKTINDNYTLTWEFPVDSIFTYFLRLHFCEFQPPIQQQGDRDFRISIANFTAEGHADVIYWSGGNGIPIYRDYVVIMGAKGNQKFQNLSIALQTNSWRQTSYSDAILNGAEIFKLSNNGNLAGPNPDPSSGSPRVDATPIIKPSSSRNKGKTLATIVGCAVAGFVALSLLFLFIFRRRLRVKDSDDGASRWGIRNFTSLKSSKTSYGSSLPSDLCRRFSLAEIKAATNNFDDVFIIGVGGFGNVYKGLINEGSTTVAIKRLNPGSQQGANEFKTEIEMLSQLRHLHLVSLIGYCNEDEEMVLVYDYMAFGTLREHLYKTDNPPLSWKGRLEICIGAARGLLYLHSGAKNTIIHRDVKTTNILLDEKWVAKVSDFGLSKIGPANMANAHVSTVVKGSFGYLDPEYYRLQRLTEKSDVYSFGVVLCEVLCARPPVNRTAGRQPPSLAEWVRQSYRNGTLNEIIDPYLNGMIAPECLAKFTEVAVTCLMDSGLDRPSMSDVVWGLEFALQLQESAEKRKLLGEESQSEMRVMESPFLGSSIDESEDMFSNSSGLMMDSRISGITITSSSSGDGHSSVVTNSSEKMMSGAVFSEIMNPAGR